MGDGEGAARGASSVFEGLQDRGFVEDSPSAPARCLFASTPRPGEDAFAQGKALMDTSAVESLIRSDASVADCRVLPRKSAGGRDGLVAYVLPNGVLATSRIRKLTVERLPAEQRPEAFVSIPAAPLTSDGAWDVDALGALPVLDDAAVLAAERAALAQGGATRVAGIAISGVAAATPLHLSDIDPDWVRPSVRVAAATSRDALTGDAAHQGAAPALSDGGELHLPPDGPRVLGDVLTRAAGAPPPAGVLHYGTDGSEAFVAYENLRASALSLLTGLRVAGLKAGDHVVLHFRSNREFLETFWACVLGGMVPVPTGVAPTYGEVNAAVRRLGDASHMLGGPTIATTADMVAELRGAAKLLGVAPFQVLAIDGLRALPPASDQHRCEPDDIALMMLTSGSTGAPKGVPLSHRNLLSRTLGSCTMNGLGPDLVSLNWMPLDHVAGLIYFHLRDVQLACRQIHVATELVLREPLLWLDLLDRYRVQITFAPNFAFGLVTALAE